MKPNLVDLTPRQFFAMYVAIVIRNAMESFHVAHLTDEQMAVLNPIIRDAIYTALEANAESDDNKGALTYVDGCLETIPVYWERPKLLDDYLYMASGKWREDLDRLLASDSDET